MLFRSYRCAYGGRGAGKSYSFAEMLLIKGAEKKLRILCVREYQNSIQESVLAQLKAVLVDLPWLKPFYIIGQNYIRGVRGTEFLFKGLHHSIVEIKSLTGVDICWIEEAETVSKQSWYILPPTIRKDGSEIWVSWNPCNIDAPTNVRFIEQQRDNTKIVRLNWRDNPWFSETQNQTRLEDLENDIDLYQHVWEGEYLTKSDALVLNGKCTVAEFEPQPEWDGPYYGADWGYSNDPTAIVKLYIDTSEKILYIIEEACATGVEIMNMKVFMCKVSGIKNHSVYADSSHPAYISHLQNEGVKIEAAMKWPGSVEAGITWIKSHKIIIHPSCKNAIDESVKWSYKTDRLTGDVKPELVKGNDHIFDATRYACWKMIRSPQSAVQMAPQDSLMQENVWGEF